MKGVRRLGHPEAEPGLLQGTGLACTSGHLGSGLPTFAVLSSPDTISRCPKTLSASCLNTGSVLILHIPPAASSTGRGHGSLLPPQLPALLPLPASLCSLPSRGIYWASLVGELYIRAPL